MFQCTINKYIQDFYELINSLPSNSVWSSPNR